MQHITATQTDPGRVKRLVTPAALTEALTFVAIIVLGVVVATGANAVFGTSISWMPMSVGYAIGLGASRGARRALALALPIFIGFLLGLAVEGLLDVPSYVAAGGVCFGVGLARR